MIRGRGRKAAEVRDKLEPIGRVELFVTRGAPVLTLTDQCDRPGIPREFRHLFPPAYRHHDLSFSGCDVIEKQDIRNILVNFGKDQVVSGLTSGFVHPVMRMAVGDRGTIPSDLTVPKTPVATQTALFNEIFRADLDATVLNVGTPTVHEAKFIKTFSAVVIPLTAFSNQSQPVVNEIGLITADVLGGAAFPRAAVASPATPPTDERLFSIRTFKSVPFEAANEIAVTIRYTIFIE